MSELITAFFYEYVDDVLGYFKSLIKVINPKRDVKIELVQLIKKIIIPKLFFWYANRLHPGFLTLQCQTKGSMGERSKPALC